MLEVYPGVRVAPDEHGEEEGADGGREQHNHQTKQALVTGGHQRSVIQPTISGVSYKISRNQRVGTTSTAKKKKQSIRKTAPAIFLVRSSLTTSVNSTLSSFSAVNYSSGRKRKKIQSTIYPMLCTHYSDIACLFTFSFTRFVFFFCLFSDPCFRSDIR